MKHDDIPTRFAPSSRAPREIVEREAAFFRGPTIPSQFLNAVPQPVVVLNRQRQIVRANEAFVDFVGATSEEEYLGKRPGEALRCIHSCETRGGCGTTEFCRTCGAVQAILESQRKGASEHECRISRALDLESLDLRVKATQVEACGESFTIFATADINDENRRKALERIFFHDVLNTAGAIAGFIQLFNGASPKEMQYLAAHASDSIKQLLAEIRAQREIVEAENHEISVQLLPLQSLRVVEDTVGLYRSHEVAIGKSIVVDEQSADVPLVTDGTLLGRVLGNLIKNALEATPAGGRVTVGTSTDDGEVRFWVHNDGLIPRDSQLQIFQRSYSTKGPGRGLGTYSVRLITERYLEGKATFASSLDDGTTFQVRIPSGVKHEDANQISAGQHVA